LKAYRKYKIGPVMLEKLIEGDLLRSHPHNTIYKFYSNTVWWKKI